MISDVHFVKVVGSTDLHTIMEIDWKQQTVTFRKSEGITCTESFSNVEFILDSDTEVEELIMSNFNNNY